MRQAAVLIQTVPCVSDLTSAPNVHVQLLAYSRVWPLEGSIKSDTLNTQPD